MQKVTLADVAEAAGVHTSTVSRALDPDKASLVSDETRDKVRDVAARLGYQGDAVASGLRKGRSFTLGVVVPDLGNPFFAPVIRGIENHLDGRGLMALIAETQDNRDRSGRVLESFRGRRVDAIISAAARLGDERMLRRAAAQVPVVLAVRSLPDSGLPAITHDDERGGRLAAEHLLELGHRRIGHLVGPDDISSFRGRGAGFRAGLAGADVELVEIPESARHPILTEGKRLMQEFLRLNDELPTAFFVHNDLMAFGALQALDEHGVSCPGDVAMVGYNDTPMTEFTKPPITTIRLPGYELGRMAADTAVMLMDDRDRPGPRLTLPPVLVARDSTLGWRPDRSTTE